MSRRLDDGCPNLAQKYGGAASLCGGTMSIFIREAKETDSQAVFEWRNDIVSRQMFHSTNEVSWPDHMAWFAASLKNEKRLMLICCESDKNDRVGIVRFEIEGRSALISINLAPEKRGRNLSRACLTGALDYLAQKHPENGCVVAEIKKINIASRKIFESLGFAELSDRLDYAIYQFDLQSWITGRKPVNM